MRIVLTVKCMFSLGCSTAGNRAHPWEQRRKLLVSIRVCSTAQEVANVIEQSIASCTPGIVILVLQITDYLIG